MNRSVVGVALDAQEIVVLAEQFRNAVERDYGRRFHQRGATLEEANFPQTHNQPVGLAVHRNFFAVAAYSQDSA